MLCKFKIYGLVHLCPVMYSLSTGHQSNFGDSLCRPVRMHEQNEEIRTFGCVQLNIGAWGWGLIFFLNSKGSHLKLLIIVLISLAKLS